MAPGHVINSLSRKVQTMGILAPNTHAVNAVNYSTGIDLYRGGKPVTACVNKWQRQGWHDARSGERAHHVIAAVVASGGKAFEADRALAGEWR